MNNNYWDEAEECWVIELKCEECEFETHHLRRVDDGLLNLCSLCFEAQTRRNRLLEADREWKEFKEGIC